MKIIRVVAVARKEFLHVLRDYRSLVGQSPFRS